ncbi:MAG: hypothetical protein ACK5M7_21450 [Draconibacterium sp.]
MKKLLYIIALTGLLWSCTEDHGNYDYLPSNKITITGFNGELVPEVMYVQLQKDDSIKLKPDVIFDKEDESDALKFEWYSGGELISEEDSLAYPVKELKEYREGTNLKPFIKLVATNTSSGDIDMLGCYAEVEPPRGWVVLTKQSGGEHQLSYFYNDWASDNSSLTLEADVNVYERVNPGETLGSDVVKIRSHYTAGPQSTDNILVVKSEYPYTIDVNGETFAKNVNTMKLFAGGNVPENYSPIDECATTLAPYSAAYIINQDGSIYSRFKNTPTEHLSGVYTPEPYYVDAKGARVTRIWPSVDGFFCAWMYDDLNKRLLIGTSGIGNANGVAAFPADPSKYGDESLGFPKFYDLQGEILYIGETEPSDRTAVMVYHSDTEGYKLIRVYMYLSQYQNTFSVSFMRDHEVHLLDETLINGDSRFLQPRKNKEVFFFTGGTGNQTLYMYEYGTGRGIVEYESFDSPIASIATDINKDGNSTINNVIAVGLKSGELKIINIHPDVVSNDALKGERELASYDLGDEIVNVIYKYGFMYNAW